jgi:hypothetical protein
LNILDGHYLPESFYVAAIQVRETLGKVLLESVENKDFTIEEAVKTAKQVMFDNSNKLYKLNLIPEIITNQGKKFLFFFIYVYVCIFLLSPYSFFFFRVYHRIIYWNFEFCT